MRHLTIAPSTVQQRRAAWPHSAQPESACMPAIFRARVFLAAKHDARNDDGDEVRTIRIGSGAGYSGDRIEPAVELAEKGDIQYLVFECLGERTVALAQQARMKNPESGYDPLLEERMRAVLPLCAAKGIKIVTNMGAANPVAAARKTAEIAKSLGLSVAEDRRRRRRRRARCLQGRRSPDHGIRRHHQATRQPAAVGQRLSRRRADGAGAERRAPTSSSPAAPPIRRCSWRR